MSAKLLESQQLCRAGGGDALDDQRFSSPGFSPDHRDVLTGYSKDLRQEANQLPVRLPLNRHPRHPDLEGVAVPPSELCARRARLNMKLQEYPAGNGLNRCQRSALSRISRSSKITK